MEYNLETLGDTRFQKLCQALLTAQFPKTQCLPVNQPDGGRDAFEQTSTGFIVYQVKFVENPQSKDAREVVKSVVKSEKEKVARLIARGATEYFLLTNAVGTAHLDSGAIDSLNQELKSELGIDAACWWRDDIERRVDGNQALKWSYPDILRATDLLAALLMPKPDESLVRRTDVIRQYIAVQAAEDEQLRFKQVDLARKITELFVDVPARMTRPKAKGTANDAFADLHIGNHRTIFDIEETDEASLSSAPGACFLVTTPRFVAKFPQIVMEGAPGQGKSTVTQLLCQLHRYKFMRREDELATIPRELVPEESRVPFRIDLRDYASWVAGRDPFSAEAGAKRPNPSATLEAFVAAQVNYKTGQTFSADDLASISKSAQVLIVLDGFDEVADTGLRQKIVSEVTQASIRLRQIALSAQILVTSRPAIFANSPGFPREEWPHLQILSLSRPKIEAYARKWLEARGIDARGTRDFMRGLNENLQQPHVRDLARNPMQLAILLTLIYQGGSLPDKRTALYDRYIEIFLDREGEKSEIVRKHRGTVVDIHRYLAWKLQVEAENSGAGHISETELLPTLKQHLVRVGHNPELVDQLFAPAVERVMALVSRIQGTFEFEVQPLREYFAARYLYDTAQHSPVGDPRPGTITHRFEAITRNYYWLNVARFYAGCYSSGELHSLLGGLQELAADEQFVHLRHPAEIAALLLGDYVFNQQPKLAASVADFMLDDTRFRRLLAARNSRTAPLVFPAGPARDRALEACAAIVRASPADVRDAAAMVITGNSDSSEVERFWRSLRDQMSSDEWLAVGNVLNILPRLSRDEVVKLARSSEFGLARLLSRFGRAELGLGDDPRMWSLLVDDLLDLRASPFPFAHEHFARGQTGEFIWATSAILTGILDYHLADSDLPLFEAIRRHTIYAVRQDSEPDIEVDDPRIVQSLQTYEPALRAPLKVLRSDSSTWRVCSNLNSIWGDRWAFYLMAMRFADLIEKVRRTPGELSDSQTDLVLRAAIARANANDASWWANQLEAAQEAGPLTARFVLLLCLHYITPSAAVSLSAQLSGILNGLSDEEWTILLRSVRVGAERDQAAAQRQKAPGDLGPDASPRLVAAMADRNRLGPQLSFWVKHMAAYRGSDFHVLSSFSRWGLDLAQRHPEQWPAALSLASYAYSKGVVAFFGRHREKAQLFSLEDAVQICAHSPKYPLDLVSVAEAALAERVGKSARRVGEVAQADGWWSDT
ncbi:MAG: hypothetical protein NVV62_08195 [Terricaulis sp.]|nr:hypothetical protein [Terricaulis sp.]